MATIKYNDKKHFFCVCPKCDNKIFEHNGYIHTKGVVTFAVKCPKCGEEFQHVRHIPVGQPDPTKMIDKIFDAFDRRMK